MTTQEILKLCGKGEQTPVQMKERVTDAYELGKEMVCYANERGGGLIIIGVNDKTGKVMAYNKMCHKKEGFPLYIIEGAAHNANDDQPQRVNGLLKEFLHSL